MKVDIKYLGVELEVIGDYSPYDKGDFETPPAGSEFEIHEIMYKGVNVYEIYESVIDLFKIEQEALATILNNE